MFGEDYLSDSPRASSPWDPFLPSPPSETGSLEARRQARNGIPKLVPEIEEGNIEYKLKLTDISPARFARLVTQLKWRLLEGAGQAYYELGVADSGALIGLSRSDLEKSLETLEMMAGEIGASVIVVKEIEVPPAMVVLADKVSAYIDPDTGEWTEKMCNKRRRALPRDAYNGSVSPSYATENDADATDFTDTDETSLILTPNFPPESCHKASVLVPYSHRLAPSNPSRPTAQSSPAIFPIDDDLALFSMEPEPSLSDTEADVEDPGVSHSHADVPELSLDIEITPVYKPRPIRRPEHIEVAPGDTFGRPARRLPKNKEKRPQQSWRSQPSPADADVVNSSPVPNKQEAKALLRRIARDKRREGKRKASGATAAQLNSAENAASDLVSLDKAQNVVVQGLEALHVGVQEVAGVVAQSVAPVGTELECSVPDHDISNVVPEEVAVMESKEARLIVEALVVRKLSLEEEFLDFGNLGSLSLS